MKTMTMLEVQRAHRNKRDINWFDPEATKFFRTKLESEGFIDEARNRVWFVTSERPPGGKRMYSIRYMDLETGMIETAGAFYSISSHAKAVGQIVHIIAEKNEVML